MPESFVIYGIYDAQMSFGVNAKRLVDGFAGGAMSMIAKVLNSNGL